DGRGTVSGKPRVRAYGLWHIARSLRSLYTARSSRAVASCEMGIWLAHCVRSILPGPVGQSHPARWAYSSCHKPYAICHKPEWGVLLLGCESLSCSWLSAVNL